jgi:hypothetical protein
MTHISRALLTVLLFIIAGCKQDSSNPFIVDGPPNTPPTQTYGTFGVTVYHNTPPYTSPVVGVVVKFQMFPTSVNNGGWYSGTTNLSGTVSFSLATFSGLTEFSSSITYTYSGTTKTETFPTGTFIHTDETVNHIFYW